MERTPVDSSNIASIGYDAGSRVLEVEFKSNAIYEYYDVSQEVATDFMNASSHGSYLYHNLRGSYQYRRIA